MSPREWHPDELELELSRTGEADERVQAHVQACDRCRSERDALAAMASEMSAPPPAVLVPRARDAAIRAAIPQVRPAHRARTLLFVLAPVAAAAAIALFVLWPRGDRSAEPAPPPRVALAPSQPGDVNRDGVIDVRDAYALARALQGGREQATWDVTGDGQVDRGDVDWIAMAAVSLGDRPGIGGPR
jgi:predicted anti-sigma-YlaC factor YlaD